MKKALKITGIVIGVLVLLVIVVAVALPFIINPNHFKDDIARAVKKKTGRDLSIQGDIKLSVFPWLGVEIGQVELSNAKGFGGTPFAAINEADMHVRFWPLLHGKIEVGEVKLDGLDLDLQRAADGHDNWQDISEHMAHGGQAASGGVGESGSFSTDLSVASVSVSDSQVRWTDAEKHQQYTISDFSLKLGAFAPAKPLSVDAGFDFTGTNPTMQGHADFSGTAVADLDNRSYSADSSKLELKASGDAVPGGSVDAVVQWQHAAVNLQNGSVALNGFSVGAYGLKFTLEAQGKDIRKQPSFNGSAKLERFSPRELLKALGRGALADSRDSSAYTSASGAFSFVATPSSVALAGLDFRLDDTHLTGQAAIKDFKSQALSFDLDVDKVDADRYLPPQQAGTPDKPREEVDVDKIGVPLRTLRSLDVDGHLHVGEFTLLNTRTNDFDMGLSAHDGLVTIKPLSAVLYSGSLKGDMTVDAREANGDSPIVSENLILSGVQVAGLARDLAKTDRLSGTLELSASTRAQGRLVGELRHTLGGRMSFNVQKGSLVGVNVWDSIARAYAMVKGQAAPPPAPAVTEFADMHGSAVIRRGVMDNRDFTALLPFLTLTGAGKLDLAELTVDYSLKGKVTGSPQLGSRQDLSGLKGTVVPLHITGTLSNLSVRPDFGGALKGKVEEALDKQKADIKKKAADKLKDILGGNGPPGG